MNMLKKYIKDKFILVGLIIVLALILPMFLDVLNWGRYIPFYKNTSADGWLSFLGALLGFAIIFITIKHEKKQFNEDKRISVKPYLNMTNIAEITQENLLPHNVIFINGDGFNKEGLKRFDLKIKIEFENIGVGNALDCRILAITSTYKPCKVIGENIVLGVISTNKNKEIHLKIIYYDDEDIENKIHSKESSNITQEIHEYIRKETSREIKILLEYKDILNNWYEKEFILECWLDANITFNYTKIESVDIIPNAKIRSEKFKEKYIENKKS